MHWLLSCCVQLKTSHFVINVVKEGNILASLLSVDYIYFLTNSNTNSKECFSEHFIYCKIANRRQNIDMI